MADGAQDHESFARAARAHAAGAGPLSAARAEAFDYLGGRGLPGRRIEGWRWSDFDAALRAFSPRESAPARPKALFDPSAAYEIAIVNGEILPPAAPAPAGLEIVFDEALAPGAQPDGLRAFGEGAPAQGLGLRVAGGASIAPLVVMRHVGIGTGVSASRARILLGEDASLTIVEWFEGEGSMVHAGRASLARGASLTRLVGQDASEDAVIFNGADLRLDEGARLRQAGFSTGARLSRHDALVRAGADADIAIDSVALVAQARHTDFTTRVDFEGVGGRAAQRHKSVIAETGRAVFQGKFAVSRPAQKTDARMNADAILLSDGGEADHKPELEIYADDVECAHGSTVGALDTDALFYLRQRGLSEGRARALLIEAFVGALIDDIREDAPRDLFRARLEAWLEASQ